MELSPLQKDTKMPALNQTSSREREEDPRSQLIKNF